MKTVTPNIINAVRELQSICFYNAWERGWHAHFDGTPFSAEEQNEKFPIRIALIHSELSESLEGWRKDLVDDKIPHRRNDVVELADAVIRIFDLAGAMQYDLAAAIADKILYNAKRSDHDISERMKPNGKKI